MMRQSIALACAVMIGLTAVAERAAALEVFDVFHYLDLRRNSNGSLDPRFPMFIDITDIDGRITSRNVDFSQPLPVRGFQFPISSHPLLNFGPSLRFGASEPQIELGAVWRTPNNDVTAFAQSSFTMSVSDESETVTAVLNPLIGPNETAEFLPLVSNVSITGDPLAPTVSWINPADMTGVDLIRVRVIDTDSVTFFTEVYDAVITDLTATSFTVEPGFLFAGDFQLRVQLEDQETVTDVLNGVERTSLRTVSRSTNITDITVVPLPGSVYMMLSALAVFAWVGRRRLFGSR